VTAHTLDSIVIGPNARMRSIFEYLELIGPGMGSVLVTGESGTGKEVVATALHLHSPRRNKPFVAVSCALFADTLIESELFGHERGAFTGAIAARPGRFERAQGGTLFLDDIDDVPMSMQVKLLRALQNRTVERLGSTKPIPIDVRVVAGTKRDLRQMVSEGSFREDLYYRLNVLSLALPPLRERRDDLPVLTEHFLDRFFRRRGMEPPPLSEGVSLALQAYDWPGNVRELENTCERIAESCTCGHVRVGCLGASILFNDIPEIAGPAAGLASDAVPDVGPEPAGQVLPAGMTLDERLRKVEFEIIMAALRDAGGNKSRAAAVLGVKRSTLGDRIARLGVER
jgi:DNA-binding NtrC family response regulator